MVAANRLSLTVPAGEVFGLVGPNGAGKTTTLKMICGLLAPTSGRVTVHGVDVERDPEAAHARTGYLADFFSLYDELRVWEYLDYFAHAYKMPKAAIRPRITEVLHLMGIEDRRDAFIAGLSRGMKQRLGIARAILHDPPVLVLDEPAVGLDPRARVEFKELVGQLRARGRTVFITSHLLGDLQEMCTSVAIIEAGSVVRTGRIEEIVHEPGARRRVRIKVTSPAFPLAAWLSSRPWVSNVAPDGAGVRFEFAGGETEIAALVKALVLEGAGVYAVEDVAETLEQVVSRLSTGETS